MKTFLTLLAVVCLLAAVPAGAGGHKGDRAIEAPAGQQPESGKVRRVGDDQAPRGGKPKPKPKPPKESGEKGGTEDINIGVGELQEYVRVGHGAETEEWIHESTATTATGRQHRSRCDHP